MIGRGHIEAAFDAAGTATKKVIFVPERGHNDVSASPVYWEAIADFVRSSTT